MRLSSVVRSCLPFPTARNSGLLPSFGVTRSRRYYQPIRHPADPVCPSRDTGYRVLGIDRTSRVPSSLFFQACQCHYPGGIGDLIVLGISALTHILSPNCGLPLISAESASAWPFSRPARHSLAFRPAWSLNRPKRSFYTAVLQFISLPP